MSFLLTFSHVEVCLLVDVAEHNKNFGKHFLIAVKSYESRSAATSCDE